MTTVDSTPPTDKFLSLWSKALTVSQAVLLVSPAFESSNCFVAFEFAVEFVALLGMGYFCYEEKEKVLEKKKLMIMYGGQIAWLLLLGVFRKVAQTHEKSSLTNVTKALLFQDQKVKKKRFRFLRKRNDTPMITFGTFFQAKMWWNLAVQSLVAMTTVAAVATYISTVSVSTKTTSRTNQVKQKLQQRVQPPLQNIQEEEELVFRQGGEDSHQEEAAEEEDTSACYLVYEADSSGRMLEIYSKTPIENAIGMWIPGNGKELPDFKFTQGRNSNGRNVLIGNCAAGKQGRQNYASGWCSFVRAAQHFNGIVTLVDPLEGHKGLLVDVYIYNDCNAEETVLFRPFIPTPVGNALAVACMPRNSRFPYLGISGIPMNKWLEDGRKFGTSTKLKGNDNISGSLVAESPAMKKRSQRRRRHSIDTPIRPSASNFTSLLSVNQTIQEKCTTIKNTVENTAISHHNQENVAPPRTNCHTPAGPSKDMTESLKTPLKPVNLAFDQFKTPKAVLQEAVNTNNIMMDQNNSMIIFEDESSIEEEEQPPINTDGACYLVYEPDSSGRLVEIYSKTPVENAVGYWYPGNGKTLPNFKFIQGENGNGRTVLIGNCAASSVGRKNYASGWCTFVRSAKLLNGVVTLLNVPQDHKGLNVDVYLFESPNKNSSSGQTHKLEPGISKSVRSILAAACVPKNSNFLYMGVGGIPLNKWLEEGRNHGTSSKF
jgi:hypothetical protein